MKKRFVLLLSSLLVLSGLSGCTQKEEQKQPEVPQVEVDETKNAEIVIVGAGGAGLAAAVEAIENGAENVIILEKTSTTGGSMNYTSGSMSGAETIIQEIDGITDTKESFVEDIMKNGAQKGNEALIRAFVEEDVAAIQWLWDNGLSDNTFSIDRATGTMSVFAPEHALYSAKRTYKPSPDDKATYKCAAHEILDQAVKGMSQVTIEFGAEATQLVQNEKGQVLSVVATVNGKTIRYDASKGVVMATGGYSGNSMLLAEFTTYGGEYLAGGASTSDGYGIYMMQEVGANIEKESLSYVPTFPMGLDVGNGPGKIAPTYTWKAGGICVNQEGERFVDETLADVEAREVALEEQTNAIQYDIFTPTIVESLQATGGSMFWDYFYAPGMPYNQFVVEAASLEELAEKLGVPYENLQVTVNNYNAHVESQETDEFGRRYTEDSINTYNLAVNKVEGDHYYAVALKALCVMTLGGVSTNEQAQVLDTAGNIIPGLYAAGECVNMWGRFVSGGTGIMGPIVFGRIAARNIMTSELSEGYTLQSSLGIISKDLFEKVEMTVELPSFDMSTALNDGTYTSTVDGQEGPMTVEVVIAEGKINAVTLTEQHESSFTASAQESIPAKIVETNSLDVDIVSGATLTTTRIVTAVKNCLEEASAQ